MVKIRHMIFWALTEHWLENNEFSNIHGPLSAWMSSHIIDDDFVSTDWALTGNKIKFLIFMAFSVPEWVATSIVYVYNLINVLLVSLNIVYMHTLSALVKDDPFVPQLKMLEDW